MYLINFFNDRLFYSKNNFFLAFRYAMPFFEAFRNAQFYAFQVKKYLGGTPGLN